jgi:hypothetical protein
VLWKPAQKGTASQGSNTAPQHCCGLCRNHHRAARWWHEQDRHMCIDTYLLMLPATRTSMRAAPV